MVSALAWAGLVLAGCTDIEPAANEIEKGKQYTLCIKAKKGTPETKTLEVVNNGLRSSWAKGDLLKVFNATNDELIAELVAQEDGETAEFKVALTQEQAENLAAASQLKLVYKGPGYENQDGTLESLSDNCDYSVAYVSVNSVDNNEYTITTDKADFTSQQAIVQFKIEDENANIVSISKLDVNYGRAWFTVNVAASIVNSNDEKDYRYFVAIPESKFVSLTATGTDGRVYTFQKGQNVYVKSQIPNVLNNGYYYPIAVRMHAEPMLGDRYYSDGSWACNKHANNAEVVGIVVYLGSGAITEEAAGYGHGLVMALKDASQGAKWADNNSTKVFDDDVPAEKTVGTEKSLTNFGGLSKTKTMYDKNRTKSTAFPAAKAVEDYAVAVNTEKCSGWFLPSSGQWLSVIYGLCGAAFPDKSAGTWWLNGKDHFWGEDNVTDIAKVLGADSDYAFEIINAKLAEAGSYDAIETGYKDHWVSYWTSTESSAANAIRMNFGTNEAKDPKYSSIKTDNKGKSTSYRVRAFLAF
jgi:hypothetical protein